MSIFTSMGQAESRRRADQLGAESEGRGAGDAAAGQHVDVAGRLQHGVAVLMVESGVAERLADGELRRAALALAREHGFTHLAVELAPSAGGDAPLPRP